MFKNIIEFVILFVKGFKNVLAFVNECQRIREEMEQYCSKNPELVTVLDNTVTLVVRPEWILSQLNLTQEVIDAAHASGLAMGLCRMRRRETSWVVVSRPLDMTNLLDMTLLHHELGHHVNQDSQRLYKMFLGKRIPNAPNQIEFEARAWAHAASMVGAAAVEETMSILAEAVRLQSEVDVVFTQVHKYYKEVYKP